VQPPQRLAGTPAIGGVLWIASVTIAGFFLGQIGFIRDNLDLIVIAAVVIVICASAFPAIAHWVVARREKKAAAGGTTTLPAEPAAE
jgi:membrane-associated protein